MNETSKIPGIAAVCFLLFSSHAESWEILDGKHDPRFALLDVTALGLNSDGVASKQEPKGDIAGGVAFPSEQFPPFDKTVVFKGIPFRLVEKEIKLSGGEAKRVNNKFGHGGLRSNYGKHYVRAPFIKPPPGYYSHLYILGCSEEDVWTEPKLNIMYGHRDYVQAKLSRWDATRTDARDEFPALQLKKMYRDGKLVRQKGTLWVKKIKLNPNVPGTSGRRFGIQIFPEIPLTFGTHVFAMTAERAPLYLKVEGFKHYHYQDQSLDLSVTVFNTTDKPRDAALDIRLTHFFGNVIGKPIRLKVPPATMEKTDKGEVVKPGAITRSVPLKFQLRGHYWLDALLRDPSVEEIAGVHERTFIHRRNFGIQSSIHVQPNSGPIGSPENELVKLFGAKDVDRNARSDYIQMTLGRCNGEAELTQHDPARYAHVIKEQYLKGQEKNPGARALIFGASGYSEDWWLKFIQNGGYDYIDAMWLEPVITPKAPESVSGFWKVGSSHDWMKLFQKYGHREVEARLNIQGRPHGDPGLGIFWADQGVSDKVTGKYAGRAIIMLAREAEHISLTDSWSRQYNARWWDAWGMTDAAGPFSRVAAAITCFAMLDRSKYVGQLELGDDIYCYLFLGENGPLMALWTTKVVPETVSLNVGADRVRITDLMDNSRFERCADRTLAIELTDSPIFVEGFSRKLLGNVRQEPETETLAPLKTTLLEKQVFIALDVNQKAHHRWQRVVNIQAGQESSPEFSVHVYNFSNEKVQGIVDIIAPEGWKVTPQKLKVSVGPKAPEKLNEKGKPIPNPDRYRKTFPLRIHVPIDAKGDVYHLYAQASFQGRPKEKVSLDNIRVHSPLRIHEGLTDPMSHNPLVEVTVRNPLKTDLAGTVKLVAEKAVTVQPASVQLKPLKPGEERRLQFRIRSKEPKPFNHYDVTAEAILNGTTVIRTETLDFFVIVPAPEAPKIDGMLTEWQTAHPFHLRYPNLEGGAPLSDRWMQDNYIYHFRKAGYQAKAWLMYDRDYLYMAFDVQDDWVTGELAAIYAYTGLLDHADEQMVVIDADSSGAVNLRPDGLAERSFVFMPRGPRESPYTGKFADPFPVFKEPGHAATSKGLRSSPAILTSRTALHPKASHPCPETSSSAQAARSSWRPLRSMPQRIGLPWKCATERSSPIRFS